MLFQFESDSRRKNRLLTSRIEQLELKISAYIRSEEAKGTKNSLDKINVTQHNLFADFLRNRKGVTGLLELLVTKDEKLESEINSLKTELKSLKEQVAL